MGSWPESSPESSFSFGNGEVGGGRHRRVLCVSSAIELPEVDMSWTDVNSVALNTCRGLYTANWRLINLPFE